MTVATVWMALPLAAVPASLFLLNLFAFRRLPPAEHRRKGPAISVLVPARNEEARIRGCIESVCCQEAVEFEVIVLDDHSTDRTPAIVEEWSRADPRVRLERSPQLPAGWCGKQHACATLASLARHDLLVFLDADVRLEPAALARLRDATVARRVSLLSGFPRQETGTWLEKLVLPLMHFLLLGFLPMAIMRRSAHPAFGAGCGQLFVAERHAYERAGGHAAIRASRHDGITLPRAFRRQGLLTDLCDATDLARCRMYRSASEVWQGLAKNATEGLATSRGIVPWTLILIGGQVLPSLLLAITAFGGRNAAFPPSLLVAVAASFSPRIFASLKFRQSFLGVVLHPLGVLVLVAIQWYALVKELRGLPVSWKGRSSSGSEKRVGDEGAS